MGGFVARLIFKNIDHGADRYGVWDARVERGFSRSRSSGGSPLPLRLLLDSFIRVWS